MLSINMFRTINQDNQRKIRCGNFNAHNKNTDDNGNVMEELLEERFLVCLNASRGTRLDVYKNSLSCMDLTLVSRNLVCSSE